MSFSYYINVMQNAALPHQHLPHDFKHYRAPNSNRKVASLMPTLGVLHCCVLEKILNATFSASIGATQWIRKQVDNHKVINSQFDL